MKESITQVSDRDFALCRSGLYEALALGFTTPTLAMLERLCTKPQNRALLDLAAVLENGRSSSSRLQAAILSLRKCPDVDTLKTLHESCRILFGHTAHSKVPPYETEYGSDTLFQQPQQLSDLSGFYNAFGLQQNAKEHERVDHVSCECEFLAFLNMKEAYALENNEREMGRQITRAQKLFLRDHLARFAPAFSNLLVRENPKSFYAALGKLLKEFIFLECARFNIPTGPENLRLRPKASVDDCLTCGSGQELIQEISGQKIN